MAKAKQTSNATVAKTDTRARSEKIIASLDRVTDRAALEEFVKGSNKRLSLRAATKLAEPATRAATTASRKAGAAERYLVPRSRQRRTGHRPGGADRTGRERRGGGA